jgi:hypothetical protein
MHTKSWMILGVVLVITVLLGTTVSPVAKVQADASAQNASPLSGYRIYFSEANSEASRFDHSENGLSRLGGILQELGAELSTLEWRDSIPAEADLLVIPGPMWNLTGDKIARLWVYLNQGGSILLLADASGDPTYDRLPAGSGFFDLLWVEMGFRGLDDIVVKENAASPASPASGEGEAPLSASGTSFLQSASFTTTNLDTTHPITAGIDHELAFFLARSLEIGATPGSTEVTPLVYAGSDYYGETTLPEDPADATFEFAYDSGVDIEPGELPLAAAIDDKELGAHIVFIGDRDFATNGFGLNTASKFGSDYAYPGNVEFLLNAITWLLDTEPIEISTQVPGFSTTTDTAGASD